MGVFRGSCKHLTCSNPLIYIVLCGLRFFYSPFYLVAGEGCGCPVDTSVQSTEAPTEAAAETLNQYRANFVCLHPQNIVVSHTAVSDTPCFCFFKYSLHPPPAAGALETPCHEPSDSSPQRLLAQVLLIKIKTDTPNGVSVLIWLREKGAGVRWTPLCKAQKHRPRRQPRP